MSEYLDGERPVRRDSPSAIRLVTVEGKVDSLVAWHKERRIDDDKDRAAVRTLMQEVLDQAKLTNGRVNALEAWKDKLSGVWTALVIVGTAAAAGAGALGWCAKLIIDHFGK